MSLLTKFASQAPAASISAKQLDDNFMLVGPSDKQDTRQDRLFKATDGWRLEIYPAFPGGLSFLCFDGQPRWMLLEELLAFLQEQGAATSQEMNTPPTGAAGTPSWRQVERCNGQTMYVWGTEWT